jgi:O-antigen/teichoic acid export membrane protein
MVLVASSLVLIFADLAFGSALVQKEKLTEMDRSTVFWTNISAGLLFSLGGIALSGPIASFYHDSGVKPLFAVFSLTFFVTALSSTHIALLSREMNFRTLELRQMISYASGAVVGIVVAAKGGGAWAIIFQQLTIAVASTLLLTALAPWRPKFMFSFASLRSMAGFSGRLFGSRILFYLNRNIDNILVGRYLGSASLGIYSLAYNVMLLPFSQIASPIQEVLYPAFARIQEDHERIGRGWLRVNRAVGAISIPALLGLIVVAPDFVPTLLGKRWDAAVPVVQILCWVGLLQSLQRMNSSILAARDHTQALLRYSVIVLVASVAAFVGGLHWGVVGVAAAYAISSTIVEPYYTWITLRAVEMSVSTFLRSLRGVVEASVAMVAAVLTVRLFLIEAGIPPAARLALCILVGALVYFPVCAWRTPELVRELDGVRRRFRRSRAPIGGVQPSEP